MRERQIITVMPPVSWMKEIIGVYCPACGQHSLFLLHGQGNIYCKSPGDCPDREAAQKILGDQETEHVIVYRDGTYVVRHPLRERIGDALVECELAAAVFRLGDHPQDGRYRMWFDEDDKLVRERVDG